MHLLGVVPGPCGQGLTLRPSCNAVVPVPSTGVGVGVDSRGAGKPRAFGGLVCGGGALQELEESLGPVRGAEEGVDVRTSGGLASELQSCKLRPPTGMWASLPTLGWEWVVSY